jgi:hypothetical protein
MGLSSHRVLDVNLVLHSGGHLAFYLSSLALVELLLIKSFLQLFF